MNKSNTISRLLFCLAVVIAAACDRIEIDKTGDEKLPATFEYLSENFKDPPTEYSTAPFWVWNDRVTMEKIDRQLALYKEEGINMIFIHPRPGLITEYLSREWFELTRYAVVKAEELDMIVWLYDENSYPSGFAGGHVPAMMPESYNQAAGLELTRLQMLTPEDSGKYYLIIKKIDDRFANITHGIGNYYNQPGDYYAFTKWYYPEKDAWFGGWSYVDLLAEGVTEKFIKLTMTGYEETLGEDLGTRVPGIFTDEPNINTRGGNTWVIRYTPGLFSHFEERYGYQLQTYLPCLYDDIGDYKNIRHDYYALLLDLFIERWAEPWYEYTDSVGLKWTGHYWEHGWPNPKHGGDNMAMYAWHQIPGIDMLFNTEEIRPDQFGNVRAVKELSSVANQLGKHRTLSETYGGAGWELTFEDMKRLGDWEYVLGVNFMNQHLSYMTIKGARKRDFPQSMSYHAPWWENYDLLNDYFHRLSFALSLGEQKNRILIIEPTTSAWMYFHPAMDRAVAGNHMEEYRNSFHDFLDKLEKYQVEYDLGSERIIRDHGLAEDGKFIIGKRAYDLVIVPPMFENFEKRTFELVSAYLEQNGNVLSFAGIPSRLDGNHNPDMKERLASYSGQWMTYDELDETVIQRFLLETGFIAGHPENRKDRVYHQRRTFEDGQLLFWVNFDKDETARIGFDIAGQSALFLDPVTGRIEGSGITPVYDQLNISFDLPPANSKLIYISDNFIDIDQAGQPEPSEPRVIEPQKLSVQPESLNMLTLDYLDLYVGNKTLKDLYFYNAADTVYKYHLEEKYGFNYNPWSVAVQYRTNILDKNRFGSESGFRVVYPFNLGSGYIPDTLVAVVEWPELFTFKINGNPIEPMEGEWWLDKGFGILNCTGHLQNGRNELEMSVQPMDILAEIEPVYLLGDFSLQSSENGWLIRKPADLKTGSWKDQGYPFYSGKVSYSRSFNTVDEIRDYEIGLQEWDGTVAEVFVNGTKAGLIGWPPYRMDISDHTVEGKNRVTVKVTGSLKNLLGPHHNNPRKGIVTPWSFFYAPLHQPPGNTYHLLDYGLYEPFEIRGIQ